MRSSLGLAMAANGREQEVPGLCKGIIADNVGVMGENSTCILLCLLASAITIIIVMSIILCKIIKRMDFSERKLINVLEAKAYEQPMVLPRSLATPSPITCYALFLPPMFKEDGQKCLWKLEARMIG